MNPKVKQIRSTRNRYVAAGNLWIRDPFLQNCVPLQDSHCFDPEEFDGLVKNQLSNEKTIPNNILDQNYKISTAVIIGEGVRSTELYKQCHDFPDGTSIVSIGSGFLNAASSTHINLVLPQDHDRIDHAKKYYPSSLFSIYANTKLVEKSQGLKFHYVPTPQSNFGSGNGVKVLDDYRCPVNLALTLVLKLGAVSILLVGCDRGKTSQLPGMVEISKGTYSYPNQLQSHKTLDAQAYWANENGRQIFDLSCGYNYNYIKTVGNIHEFLQTSIKK